MTDDLAREWLSLIVLIKNCHPERSEDLLFAICATGACVLTSKLSHNHMLTCVESCDASGLLLRSR